MYAKLLFINPALIALALHVYRFSIKRRPQILCVQKVAPKSHVHVFLFRFGTRLRSSNNIKKIYWLVAVIRELIIRFDMLRFN